MGGGGGGRGIGGAIGGLIIIGILWPTVNTRIEPRSFKYPKFGRFANSESDLMNVLFETD